MITYSAACMSSACKEALWIDATAEASRVGTLPLPYQGRHALSITRHAPGLIDTPTSTATENFIVRRIEVPMNDQGKADIEEGIEASGTWEGSLRARFTGDEAT